VLIFFHIIIGHFDQFVDEQGNPVVLAGDQQVLILDESSGQPILHDSQGQQIQLGNKNPSLNLSITDSTYNLLQISASFW
jgi:hypothetical protein